MSINIYVYIYMRHAAGPFGPQVLRPLHWDHAQGVGNVADIPT